MSWYQGVRHDGGSTKLAFGQLRSGKWVFLARVTHNTRSRVALRRPFLSPGPPETTSPQTGGGAAAPYEGSGLVSMNGVDAGKEKDTGAGDQCDCVHPVCLLMAEISTNMSAPNENLSVVWREMTIPVWASRSNFHLRVGLFLGPRSLYRLSLISFLTDGAAYFGQWPFPLLVSVFHRCRLSRS